MLLVAVAQSYSGDSAMCCILQVLCMMLCFHIIGHMWCTVKLKTEGCQSDTPLCCLLLTDILPCPWALPYTREFGCGGKQGFFCVEAKSAILNCFVTHEFLQLLGDICVQLFYMVTEPYLIHAGKDVKDMRRWAYEIFSSFLVDKAVSFSPSWLVLHLLLLLDFAHCYQDAMEVVQVTLLRRARKSFPESRCASCR